MNSHHNLIGRTFGYRLNRGSEPALLIVANVKPPPTGLELPDGTVWVRAFSSRQPDGKEGAVSASWMNREIAPSTARLLKGMFEYGVDTATAASSFPCVWQLRLDNEGAPAKPYPDSMPRPPHQSFTGQTPSVAKTRAIPKPMP